MPVSDVIADPLGSVSHAALAALLDHQDRLALVYISALTHAPPAEVLQRLLRSALLAEIDGVLGPATDRAIKDRKRGAHDRLHELRERVRATQLPAALAKVLRQVDGAQQESYASHHRLFDDGPDSKLAGLLAGYDRASKRRLGAAEDFASHRETLRTLVAHGALRPLKAITRNDLDAVAALAAGMPHFAEPIGRIRGQLVLALRWATPPTLRLRPLLLVGPPAAGKTRWARCLAEVLGVRVRLISMPSVTASWVITGHSASWNRAAPGFVARAFIEDASAQPLFVLDELDKMIEGNYPPTDTLLALLERESSTRFTDEFLDVELDVSRALWIATANRLQDVPEALRSRFEVVHVLHPTRDQLPAVVSSIYAGYRRSRPDQALPERLPDGAIDALVLGFKDARTTERCIEDGLARAVLALREPRADDFGPRGKAATLAVVRGTEP